MVRRVVTGLQPDGRSVFLSDGPVANTHDFRATPGMRTTLAWATPAIPTLPHDAVDPTIQFTSVLPDPTGTTLIIVQFPPDSVMMAPDFDPAAADAEFATYLPGLAECFEPDGAGMHRTRTVDYDIVLSGELWLELDDGEMRQLKAGDVVVQHGARHAWRNQSDQPATMAVVLIGAPE